MPQLSHLTLFLFFPQTRVQLTFVSANSATHGVRWFARYHSGVRRSHPRDVELKKLNPPCAQPFS